MKKYFSKTQNVNHKKYEALRAFYVDQLTAEQAAEKFGYSLSAFYSLNRDFRKMFKNQGDPFFKPVARGRTVKDPGGQINEVIISLRKKYLSVPDIKSVLDTLGHDVSERHIYDVIKAEGFARLPRRSKEEKLKACSMVKFEAPKSEKLSWSAENFTSENTLGIMCLWPYLRSYGVDDLIESSLYPQTKDMNKLSSILSFVALKLSNARRYTNDDAWCMDRGLGLFAGLNVLPKATWFSSYSHRITRKMNLDFLKKLHQVWLERGLLSDTANLDFTTIPYWGDDSHLERNWSGSRNKAMSSILTAIGQDADTGIITYGDTNVRHNKKDAVVLEFFDFYKNNGGDIKYLVFDSKFTTYQNLSRLDPEVKFLPIRRRGTNIVDKLDKLEASSWTKVRVQAADGKGRTLRVNDSLVHLRDYGGELRQIAITGHGKIKPALIITNEFDKDLELLIRKYARRWLVEKCISEQIEFFHLNRVSSSMVIKIDFDLTMSILAHNLLRLFAMDLEGYSHNAAQSLYDKFLSTSGSVEIRSKEIIVKLKKKRNLPAILNAMEQFEGMKIKALGNRSLIISSETRS
jgi:transposase